MLETPTETPPTSSNSDWPTGLAPAAASLSAAALAACGGGGGDAVATPPVVPPVLPPASISREQASRFLSQAALGCTSADIEQVRSLGYSGWLDAQFALPRSSSNVEWLRAKNYDTLANRNNTVGSTDMLWRKLLSSPDVLRQRVSLALSEIIVVSLNGLGGVPFRSFSAAAFMDVLEANAFGSYRTLLGEVSTTTAMGTYLSFRGNRKANPVVGSLPDENYARECMQLFSIGLTELNIDGSPKLTGGQPTDSYSQAEVSQMARVFTGWDLDTTVGTADTPDRVIRPMVQIAGRHETGEKRFLGTVIPANTDGVESLRLALDTLIAHPNAAPFISRQLIQRLVTSNPSAAYVARVAAIFKDNGAGAGGQTRGDLKAVIKAILLDTEARSDAGLADPAFGKLREPVLRFVQWARSFGVTSTDDTWTIGDLSDPATRLGQSPLRAPSVFNFFRPGYVPPNSPIAARALNAPEFQITTESSVAGYVNFMQRAITNGVAGLKANTAFLMPLVNDSAALLAELNVLLAAGQLSGATLTALKTAIDTTAVATPAGQANRINAAITLVMVAPEYLAQK
jgi:uncharacterized protein (DUF1800 family)